MVALGTSDLNRDGYNLYRIAPYAMLRLVQIELDRCLIMEEIQQSEVLHHRVLVGQEIGVADVFSNSSLFMTHRCALSKGIENLNPTLLEVFHVARRNRHQIRAGDRGDLSVQRGQRPPQRSAVTGDLWIDPRRSFVEPENTLIESLVYESLESFLEVSAALAVR